MPNFFVVCDAHRSRGGASKLSPSRGIYAVWYKSLYTSIVRNSFFCRVERASQIAIENKQQETILHPITSRILLRI